MAERKIGDLTFRVEKLPSTEALRLLTRLTKILGPALRYLDGAFDADEGRRDTATLAAIASIVETVEEATFNSLVVEAAEMAQVNWNGAYEDVIVDTHLRDDLLTVFKVAIFALEVQFKGFFDAGRASPVAQRILASRKAS
jgi:hypothetical protein